MSRQFNFENKDMIRKVEEGKREGEGFPWSGVRRRKKEEKISNSILMPDFKEGQDSHKFSLDAV